MKPISLVAITAAIFAASAAQAAVITFDASNNGQSALTPAYQPLLTGYAGDGGALGITIGWGGTWSSDRATNGGVTDHTPGSGGLGYVGYDGGAASNTITFDHAVTLPSFYFANYSAGSFTIEFKGFANVGDATPVVDIVRSYSQPSGYTWIEETGLAGYKLSAFSFTGANYKQLDDVTVLAAVPEPAAWTMLLVGFGFAGSAMRRRRTTTVVAA